MLLIAIIGLCRLSIKRDFSGFYPTNIVFFVIIFAVFVGCYHYFWIEYQVGDNILFRGLYRSDLYIHSHIASLVCENGLPLINRVGDATSPIFHPTHLGLMVLLAGFHNLTGLSFFQSSRVLAPFGLTVLSLSSLALIAHPQRNTWIVLWASISIIIWGGLTIPIEAARGNVSGLLVPYVKALLRPNCPSGTLYHNLPQIFTLALTGTGLVALQQYIKFKDTYFFVLACMFISVTFLVKPSITVLTIPSVFIFLLISRENINKYFIAGAIFVVGIGCYYLPNLIKESQLQSTGWIINISKINWIEESLKYLVLFGVVWLFVGRRVPLIWQSIIGKRKPNLEDFIVIVIFGGICFSLLFVERHEFRRFHGNQHWGLTGSIILSVPFVIVSLAEWRVKGIRHGAKIKKIIMALVGLQIIAGALYAMTFPFAEIEKFPVVFKEVLQEMRKETTPQSRFLFDPSFPHGVESMVYLERPGLSDYKTQYSRKTLSEWQDVIQKNKAPFPFIQRWNTFVVGPETEWLIPLLKEKNWRFRAVYFEKWQLWTAPD